MTTWRLVTMLPLASSTTPDPVPRWVWSVESSPSPKSKKWRKNGGTSCPRPPTRPCAGSCRISTSMRTTLGRSALATAENADDRMRASLGISVLGVTGPPALRGRRRGRARPGGGRRDRGRRLLGGGVRLAQVPPTTGQRQHACDAKPGEPTEQPHRTNIKRSIRPVRKTGDLSVLVLVLVAVLVVDIVRRRGRRRPQPTRRSAPH